MPIWGLKSVAQVIAAGFDGPQHCDEPWPIPLTVGQQVLVHLRGEGRTSVWVSGTVLFPSYQKANKVTVLQYYRVEYVDKGRTKQGDFSPSDGDVKPDCPYVRELIAEELMWPIDEPDRDVNFEAARGRARDRVRC